MRTGIEVFEKNVERSAVGCWLWRGYCTSLGYGHMKYMGKRNSAHRFSYETFVGPIPSGMCVCHKCDTPRCVRPDHLFLGTHKENTQDAVRKGRFLRFPRSKLTLEDREQIRRAERDPPSRKRLSAQYGVSYRTISAIQTGI